MASNMRKSPFSALRTYRQLYHFGYSFWEITYPRVTHRQMQWLVEAAALLPPDPRFRVKPHPVCPVQPSDYPSLQLNMSPLQGLEGVMYVTSPTELVQVPRDARDTARVVAEPYFCLDKGLPRWRKLLGFSQADAEIAT